MNGVSSNDGRARTHQPRDRHATNRRPAECQTDTRSSATLSASSPCAGAAGASSSARTSARCCRSPFPMAVRGMRSLLVSTGLLLVGCASSPTVGDDAGIGDTGLAPDTAVEDTREETPLADVEVGGGCNDLSDLGEAVTPVRWATAPPPPTGGPVAAGTYRLVAIELSTTPTGVPKQFIRLRISPAPGGFRYDDAQTGVEPSTRRWSANLTQESSTVLRFEYTCGRTDSETWSYTATSTSLILLHPKTLKLTYEKE